MTFNPVANALKYRQAYVCPSCLFKPIHIRRQGFVQHSILLPVLDTSIGHTLHAQLDQEEIEKIRLSKEPSSKGSIQENNGKDEEKGKKQVEKTSEGKAEYKESTGGVGGVMKGKTKTLVRRCFESSEIREKADEEVKKAGQFEDPKGKKEKKIRSIKANIGKEQASTNRKLALATPGGKPKQNGPDDVEWDLAGEVLGERPGQSRQKDSWPNSKRKKLLIQRVTVKEPSIRRIVAGIQVPRLTEPISKGGKGPSKIKHNLLSSRKEALKSSLEARSKGIRLSKLKGSRSLNVLKKNRAKVTIEELHASQLEITSIEVPQRPVPTLSYGLDRVLFNPGVYHLQDPRSRVYNFDPYLQTIMPVSEFDFSALKRYITSSKDRSLETLAREHGKKYVGSSSSMTGVLAHFHFLLSQWRPVNTAMLSQGFPAKLKSFTLLQRSPSAVFLKWQNGSYAMDADKEFDTSNILSMLGKSMEKLLTLSTEDYERYRKSKSDEITEEERSAPESFHYSTLGDFLMRSQLDAYDARLPGSGMFDLKTRAVVTVRMDVHKWQETSGYEIKGLRGEWESFEREYFDLIRAALLKYSLQVRMGRMDGIFVAFHNTERIFGFQYISLPEMDLAIHGQSETALGDQEFKLSIDLLNKVLDKSTKIFPEQSLRLHFETRDARSPFMYIFAEPVTEDQMQEVQTRNAAKIEAFEREVLGLAPHEINAVERDNKWEEIQADVQETMDRDEQSLELVDADLQGHHENYQGGVHTEAGQGIDGSSSADLELDEDGADENELEDVVEDNNELENDIKGRSPESDTEDIEEEEVQEEDEEREEGSEREGEDEDVQESEDNSIAQETDRVTTENMDGGQTLQKADDGAPKTVVSLGSESNTPPSAVDGIHEGIVPDITDARETSSSQKNEQLQSHILTSEPTTSPTSEEEIHRTKEGNASGDSDVDGDKTLLDETDVETPVRSDAAARHPDIFGMTLTIRNKVKGSYITRPEQLGPDDDWTVEYSLEEIKDAKSVWGLYQACQQRRKLRMDKVSEEEDDGTVGYYVQRMRDLSNKGKEWREQQDEIERSMPKVVFEHSSPRVKPDHKNSSSNEAEGA